MSLPWIAFYPGDYLRKTLRLTTEQHGAYLLLLIECWTVGKLPDCDEAKASICKLSVEAYRERIAPIVFCFFNPDGTNKRASEEVDKGQTVYEKRVLAGRKGGVLSGMARRSKRSKREANGQAKSKHTSTNQNQNLTSTFTVAARETAAVENKRPPTKEVKAASKPVFEPGPVDQAQYWMIKAGKVP